MNRRRFLKLGSVFVPAAFAVGHAKGQAFTFHDQAFMERSKPASAPAGCDTLRDSATTASSASTTCFNTSSRYYVAQRFTASASYSACKARFYCSLTGSISASLYAQLWSATGTPEPDTLLGESASGTAVSSLPASEDAVDFSLPSVALTSGTTYFLALRITAFGDASNNVKWYRYSIGTLTNSIMHGSAVPVWSLESSARQSRYALYSS